MSLMGIDIGIRGCTAGVFSEEGVLLAHAHREFSLLQRRPGWAELDSGDVFRSVKEVIAEAAAATPSDPVCALCISAMGQAITPVSAKRELLGPSILPSDIRGEMYISYMQEEIGQEVFYQINPTILSGRCTLAKLLWLRDHEPWIFDKVYKFLFWDDLVSFLLGGDAIASFSQAGHTLLFDLACEDWSDSLIEWAGLTRKILPKVLMSGTAVGTVSSSLTEELNLPKKTLIVSGGHTASCAAFGAGIISGGKAVLSHRGGPIESITAVFDHIPSLESMLEANLSIQHHVLPGLYVSPIHFSEDTQQYHQLSPAIRGDTQFSLEICRGNSTLSGLPWAKRENSFTDEMDPALTIVSKTRMKNLIEEKMLYFQTYLHKLEALNAAVTEFIAMGEGARSDFVLQMESNVLGAPVKRLRQAECVIMGAAMLAGIASGKFSHSEEAVKRFVVEDRLFEPDS